MNGHPNSYFRFLLLVVGTALALNIAWALIQPLLPALTVLLAAFAIFWLARLWRDRW